VINGAWPRGTIAPVSFFFVCRCAETISHVVLLARDEEVAATSKKTKKERKGREGKLSAYNLYMYIEVRVLISGVEEFKLSVVVIDVPANNK
jgi:hypothetical protein